MKAGLRLLNRMDLSKMTKHPKMETDHKLSKIIVVKYKEQSQTLSDQQSVSRRIKDMRDCVRHNFDVAGVCSYAAMLQVCARCRSPENGEQIWAEMKSRGIEPSHHCYVALASAYASTGNTKETVRLLNETGYQSHASKGVLLRAYAKKKKTHLMMRVFNKFIDEGFPFTGRHMVILMSGQQHPQKAWELLTTLKGTYGIRPNTLVCNAALSVCIATGDVTTAKKIVGYMHDRGIGFNESTYTTLMGVHSVNKDLAAVVELIETMGDRKMTIPATAFATFIRCCGYLVGAGIDVPQHVEQANLMMQQAVTQGYKSSNHIFTNTLEVFIKAGRVDKIKQLTSHMNAIGARPSRKFDEMLREFENKATAKEKNSGGEEKEKEKEKEEVVEIVRTPEKHERRRAWTVRKAQHRDAPKRVPRLFNNRDDQLSVTRGLRHKDMRLHRIEPSDLEVWTGRQLASLDVPAEFVTDVPKPRAKPESDLEKWVLGR